ncbi:MAG: hypothetical protein ACI4DU_09725 [Lachnospiraceae bacterium]
MNKAVWTFYAVDYVLRHKIRCYGKHRKYTKCQYLEDQQASDELAKMIVSGQPLAAGRLGLFELAAMRMYEFGKKDKYKTVMDNIYNCAGFFPNDITLGDQFTKVMTDAMQEMDLVAANHNLCENYFMNHYMHSDSMVSKSFDVFEVCRLEPSWTRALAGKKVLVVTSFPESVKHQYARRELLFPGSDILPEFELSTYQALMTVGDMRDERFATWFEALDYMKREILAMDFDIALLGCGAYGFPLAAEMKKAGKQAVHMGGVLQILFGIMGKRWDGTRTGKDIHIREDIAKYYNENWIYPLEEKPKEAGKVEYGPYWK